MIIADTGFLSSLLKIDKLNLIFKALEIKEVVITGAVLNELKKASFYRKISHFINSNKIIVKYVEAKVIENFGHGELESIQLAIENDALLLIDDRKVAKFAEAKGVNTINLPGFLFYCKNKLLSKKEILEIIKELKNNDYYEFSEEVKLALLN